MNPELSVPPEALAICRTLKDASFEAYLIGGCVRDLLIGRKPKDWDVTTNATPEQIQVLFPDSFYENDFGTVGVKTESEDPKLKVIEVTPYRLESGYSNARHPDEVKFTSSLSDDLRRRDFTVNAIAYDPLANLLVDEHKGRDDLDRKIIRAVGNANERFAEDALRTLRAVRFSSELGFVIETDTAAGIVDNAAQLAKISRERIRDEFLRTLESDTPMMAIFVMQRLGILKYIIPELEEGIGCMQNQAHSFDVFEHLVRSLQHAADKKWPIHVRIAALLHDIGKPATRRWSDDKKDWTFYGHEVVGAKIAKKIMRDLRLSQEMSESIYLLIRWHMFFSDPEAITLSAVRRMIVNVGKDRIGDLINLRICDRIGTGRPKEQPFRLRKYMAMIDEAMRDPISVGMLKIDGRRIMELGEPAGPRMGWMLLALLEEVLDDPKKNTAEHLEDRVAEFRTLPDADLKKLGEQGKVRRESEEEAAVKELQKKYHVA